MTEQHQSHKGNETAKQAPDPRDEERKKARDDSEKKNDELIKAYQEEKALGDSPEAKKAREQLVKDQEKAKILNEIYIEKYQLGVRKTPAQETLEKAGKTEPVIAGQH